MSDITTVPTDPSKPFRWWCFTINNPDEAIDAAVKALTELDIFLYMVLGDEIGKKGTPHYQGYLELKKPQRFSWVRKAFKKRAHLELRKGSRTQARDYCMKDGKYTEHGTWKPDRQGERNDLVAIKKALDEGGTSLQIAENHFGSWCRYRNAFRDYRMLKFKNRRIARTVIWLYGATGCGKSHTAAELAPEAYWKCGENKWFDGYDGEEDVVIDDFRSHWWSFSYTLRLLDIYPMSVECKGSSMPWLAKRIIITAPCHPLDMFNTHEDRAQLERRITEIRHVTR